MISWSSRAGPSGAWRIGSAIQGRSLLWEFDGEGLDVPQVKSQPGHLAAQVRVRRPVRPARLPDRLQHRAELVRGAQLADALLQLQEPPWGLAAELAPGRPRAHLRSPPCPRGLGPAAG